MVPKSPASGFAVAVAGVALATWVVAGRFAFGVGGELTLFYAVTLGAAIVVLHAFIGRAVLRTYRRRRQIGTSTVVTLSAAWLCGILLGFTIPDVTPIGLQTIFSGPTEPGLGIAIGLANPLGILTLATSIASLVLATGDARIRREPS